MSGISADFFKSMGSGRDAGLEFIRQHAYESSGSVENVLELKTLAHLIYLPNTKNFSSLITWRELGRLFLLSP
jgi:hypothetical protein